MSDSGRRDLFEVRSVPRAILSLALPTVAGQIILVIYNMADTFFLGLTGNDAMLTAATICMPAFLFLSAVSNLFGIGGGSAIARALGTGDRERVRSTAAFALWGCLAVTGLYSLLAFFARDAFVDLLGGTAPAVHPRAVEYLCVTVTLGGLATAAATLLAHLIRAEGCALLASTGIAIGGVLNIALDPLFMFVLLPPGHETLGAAAATALANFLSLLYFAAALLRRRKKTQLSFCLSGSILKEGIPAEVLAAGLPACTMTLCENVSYAVLGKLMSLSGVAIQAGVGVAKKVNMLAHCTVRGIAQGALPLIAYNFAAKNYARMKEAIRVANRIAVLAAGTCTAVCLLWSRPLIGVFIHSASPALAFGAAFLRILCIGGPFSAGAYTYISFFQAVNEGRKSFLLALLRKGVIDIPLMFLLSGVWPTFGIVAATPIADALCCLAAVLMFRAYIGKLTGCALAGEGAPATTAV